jgi:hypothetical protein
MRNLTAYTTNNVRFCVENIARKERKTLRQKSTELMMQGIALVKIEDLENTSRQTLLRGEMEIEVYAELIEKIPFPAYRQKGRRSDYLGLAIEKALENPIKSGIVELEYKTVKCSTNPEIELLKLLYPNCKVDGMKVDISLASDEAFQRLKEIIATQPNIKLQADVTRGEFSIISSEGRTAKFKRNDYEFMVEVKQGSILILAESITEDDLIVLGRDVLAYISKG